MSNYSLFLKAAEAACAEEADAIRTALNTDRGDFMELEWTSSAAFREKVTGYKFNSLYLGAHADGNGFGELAGGMWWDWQELALAICETDCMAPGGFLFLGCCRGGMKVVAMKILKTCFKIDYVCGPLWTTKGADLSAGFLAFVNSHVRNREEPSTAADRATAAAGQKFCCYDRQDVAGEVAMLQQIDRIELKQDLLLVRIEELFQLVGAKVIELERLKAEHPVDPATPGS